MAQEQLNGVQADLVFVFTTVKHVPKRVIAGIRDVLGESPRMLGGSAGGVLTNDSLGYEGYQVGVAALSFDNMTADLSIEPELVGQEYEAGQRLAERMISGESSPFLFLYDSVKKTRRNGGPELNLATPLIEGMAQSMDDWPPVAGGGLVADAQFVDPAYQLIDGRIERESVLGLSLSGDVQMDTLILHGCRPASPYHTITETDGNAILEIDG